MNTKRGTVNKGVSLPRRKAQADAYACDSLPENPTPAELNAAVNSEALAELEDRVADVRESWETDSLFQDAFDELSAETTTLDGEFDAIPLHLDLGIWTRGCGLGPWALAFSRRNLLASFQDSGLAIVSHNNVPLHRTPWLPSGSEAIPHRVACGCSILIGG